MKTSRRSLAIVLPAVTVIAAGGWIVVQQRQLAALREALAALRLRHDDAAARLAAANENRARLEARVQQLESRPVPPPPAATWSAAGPAAGGRRVESGGRGPGTALRNLADNPDFQKAMLSQLRAGLDQRYASLFRRLDLPPEALAQLKDLLVEKQAAVMDARTTGRLNGVTDPALLASLATEAQAGIDAEINALLGPGRSEQYQDYESHSAQQSIVDQLERRLSYTSSPLTTDQSEELVRLLAETGANSAGPARSGGATDLMLPPVPLPPGGTAVFIGPGGPGSSTISDAAIEEARGLLTVEQLAALRELQAEQQAAAQMFGPVREGGAVGRMVLPPSDGKPAAGPSAASP